MILRRLSLSDDAEEASRKILSRSTAAARECARELDEHVSSRLFGTCRSCTHQHHLTGGGSSAHQSAHRQSLCNQVHGWDNKASKTTSRTMLQRAPNTQHAARDTACCLDSLKPRDNLAAPLLTNSTLLLPTSQNPLYVDFGLLRRTSSYFRDLTLIVTRVTLTSIRHL